MSLAEAHHTASDFFTRPLGDSDPDVMAAIKGELRRQQDQIELIASENIVSKADRTSVV